MASVNETALRKEIDRLIGLKSPKALPLAEEFVSNHPDSLRAKLVLASVHELGLGRGPQVARSIYKEVLRIDPDNPEALSALALMHGISDEESLHLHRKAADTSQRIELYMNLGFKQWDMGKFEEARITFERVLKMAKEKKRPELAAAVKSSLGLIQRRKLPTKISYSVPYF